MRAEGVPDAPGTMKSTPGDVVDFSAEEERTMREGPDPEPARRVDDDVAHLVESLREAQRRAAGISRRVKSLGVVFFRSGGDGGQGGAAAGAGAVVGLEHVGQAAQ